MKHRLVVITLTFSLCVFPLIELTAQNQEIITNVDVVSLTKAGLDKQVIINKIRSAKTNFDLSTDALIKLKDAGVADDVLAAMLPSSSKTTLTNESPEIELNVPDGTEVEVQLKNNLSGEEAKIGDVVDLSVVREVAVNNIVVIAQGASATARITKAKKAGRWGRTGKLEWAMQDMQTVSGSRIPMRFTKTVSGGSSAGTVAVGAVLTTVLLGPVGLLWGLKKGKKAVIPGGSKFSVFADKDSLVKVRANSL